MTFWVLALEDNSALSWEALQSHWPSRYRGESQGQCLEGDTFATCRELLKTYSWGRTDGASRHRTVQLRCRAGSRKCGMIIRGSLMKEVGCEWDTPWG